MFVPWLVLVARAEPATVPPLTSAMHARYEALTRARDAVIEGHLDDAKTAIQPLTVADPTEPFPPGWRKWVTPVEGAAKNVANARDLAAAAAGVAKVAQACAVCHEATNSGPSVTEADDVPPQAWQPGQNMSLHRWAVGWMWLGLLADNDEAWLRGATELDKHPIELRFEDAVPPGGKPQLEQLVYILANLALTTEKPSARAELFGNLLGTCSQCHLQRPTP